MRLKYLIYYADGMALVGHGLADWIQMPDEGVLVVSEIHDRVYGHPRKYAGKRTAYTDYYWMDNNGEIGGGSAKLIPENVHIKRGKYVDNETWERIYNLACVDEEVE